MGGNKIISITTGKLADFSNRLIAKELKDAGMKVKRIEELFSISHSTLYYEGNSSRDGRLAERIREGEDRGMGELL